MFRDDVYCLEGFAVLIYFKEMLVVNVSIIFSLFVDNKCREIPAGVHDKQSELFILFNKCTV